MRFDGKLRSLHTPPLQAKPPVLRQLPKPARLPASRHSGEEPLLKAIAGRVGLNPRGSERSSSAGPTALADKERRGTRPEPRPAPDSIKRINPTTLHPIKEPRPDSPRCSGGWVITAPEGCLLPGQVTPDSNPLRSGKGEHWAAEPYPGTGRRRGSGATTRQP